MEAKQLSFDGQRNARTLAGHGTAHMNTIPEAKKFFFRLADGGKRVDVTANLIRILPHHGPEGDYTEVKYLDGGVWKTLFTTPFGFEMAMTREGF